MVKVVVWVVILGGLAAGMFWGMQQMNQDPGLMIGVAVSPPDDQGVRELQVPLPMLLTAAEPPMLNQHGRPDWPQWLDDHLVLEDSQGQRIPFRKGGFQSQDVKESQAGTAEFIALADLSGPGPFTLTVQPMTTEPEKYRREIPGEPAEFMRLTFPAVN